MPTGRPDDEGFGHSLTDLMASVAVLFFLIAAIFMLRSARQTAKANADRQSYEKKLNERTGADEKSRELMRDLARKVQADKQIQATVVYDEKADPLSLSLIFNNDHLHFDTGSSQPNPDGVSTIREQGPRILHLACALGDGAAGNLERKVDIFLEGHTDNQPWVERNCDQHELDSPCARLSFRSNVELSAKRAQAVYFLLRESIKADERLTTCLETQFVVSGRGPVEPLLGGDWRASQDDATQARNRRVVIKVRIRPTAFLEHPQ